MRKLLAPLALLVALCLLSIADPSLAGRGDATRCRSDKNCRDAICVKQSPRDKSGVSCRPQTCSGAGAECGVINNGCGGETVCPACGAADECVDNQCVPIPTTTTTSTSTTSTTLDNPCDPNPCTSCGYFLFFWCNAYEDGSYQCVFNQGTSGGNCESDANCAADERCAWMSTYGAKFCVDVTGVCPTP